MADQEQPGGNPQDSEGGGEQSQDSQDPLAALGQGIDALVKGVQSSQMGPDVKKQAGVVQQDFQQLVQMIGGGSQGASGQQGAMAGGNPNAVPQG